MESNRFRRICIGTIIAAIILTIGFIMGYFFHPGMSEKDKKHLQMMNKLTEDGYSSQDPRKFLIKEIKAENIRDNSKFLASKPRLAGTPGSKNVAEYVLKTWKDQGLEDVKLVPYDIFLTYPNVSRPNKVTLLNKNNEAIYTSSEREDILRDEDNDPEFIYPFHAYSPGETVEGELVYVNYGRVEDFHKLNSLGINCKNKIVIVRYGKIFRGNKVINAQMFGAIGVIIYSDPAEVAINGTHAQDVYPNSFWLQESGIQRGNVFIENGDPLTPFYPSNEYVYKEPVNKTFMPKIPSQPIGYRDAKVILSYLSGYEVPDDWKGKLDVIYRTGPDFIDQARKIRLEVNNYFTTRTIYNVIGIISGKLEPDRYVIIGNHRDSWSFGGVDAVSGMSSLLEITRAFGELKKTGWQPRRTMIFCNWDAEEFAIIGSQEWAEDFKFRLSERAVAYINIDICSMGCTFKAAASPILRQVIYHVSKEIPDPVIPEHSIYDEWIKVSETKQNELPQIPTLGSGSDYGPFVLFLGVPSIDYWWMMDPVKYPNMMYPAYHTAYDSFHLVDQHTDPGFKCHQGCGRISAETLRYLADSFLLPFNVNDFASAIFETISKFKNSYEEILNKRGIKLDRLHTAAKTFSDAAEKFHKILKHIDKSDPIKVRSVNDILMKIERAFVLARGLPPNRPLKRHILFAPSMYDSYASKGFPGIADLLYNIDEASNPDERWEDVKRHLAEIIHMISSAANFLDLTEERSFLSSV